MIQKYCQSFNAICLIGISVIILPQTITGTEIAFSAGLTFNADIVDGHDVRFDRVFSNVGGGYDSNTGVFRCPTSGIYVFTFHAVSHANRTTWLQLYHNYQYIVSTYGHSQGDYASSANSAILRLTDGDEVYIRTDVPPGQTTDQHSTLYGRPHEIYCTFSGYMVSEVFEEYPGTVG